MLDFTGPVTFAGPISVTSQVPDRQISALIQALEKTTQAIERDIMAKNKVVKALEELAVEIGELETVGAGVTAIVDRLVLILDSDDDAEAKVAQLKAGLTKVRNELATATIKGTSAADAEEDVELPLPPTEV